MKRKLSEVIDISSSDEDFDLKEAIKLSQQQNGKLFKNFNGNGFYLNYLKDQYPKASTVKLEEIIDVVTP
jgi:Mor family transcriptional regulator